MPFNSHGGNRFLNLGFARNAAMSVSRRSRTKASAFALVVGLILTACCGALDGHADPLLMPMPEQPAPIKLGIVVSATTAMDAQCDGHACGFEHAMIAKSFNQDSRFVLYAIIEPGSLEMPEIRAMLNELKINNVVDGYDARALQGLDVILAAFAGKIRPEMVRAISEAVRGGTSFLSMVSWGTEEPGVGSDLLNLMGLSKGFYMFKPEKTQLRVMHEHPLLPELHAGDVIEIAGLNGVAGKSSGISMLALEVEGEEYCGSDQARKLGLKPNDISIMNVHLFGQGRVLNFMPWGGVFPNYDGDALNRRMVTWLAARP